MNDIVLISFCDGGYWYTVMIDGVLYNREESEEVFASFWEQLREHRRKEREWDWPKKGSYPYRAQTLEEWARSKWKDKEIIICEDGEIQVIPKETEETKTEQAQMIISGGED